MSFRSFSHVQIAVVFHIWTVVSLFLSCFASSPFIHFIIIYRGCHVQMVSHNFLSLNQPLNGLASKADDDDDDGDDQEIEEMITIIIMIIMKTILHA